MSSIYRKLFIKRGWVHDNFVMHLDYTEKGKLKVSMKDYIEKVLKVFPDEIGKTASTWATDYLFQTRDKEQARKFTEEKAVVFYHSVAQLLFLSGCT